MSDGIGGEPFTAADVKYTIKLLLDNEIDSVYSANVSGIKSIDIVNDYSIVITLNEDDPYFISKLTFPILPEYYFKDESILDEEKAKRFVGTGSYKYESTEEEKIILTANDDWWKESDIKLRKIYLLNYPTYSEAIKGFKSAEVDMILTTMHNWKEIFGFIGINSYGYESSEYEVIIPNTENRILKDNSVRRAILQSINRENIINEIYDENAVIQDMPLMFDSKYWVPNAEYDVEKAKQILINAGWTEENNNWIKDGNIIKLTLMVPVEDEDKREVAKKIKDNLAEISIHITINELPQSEINKKIMNGNFELALASLDIKNEYQIQDLVKIGSKYNYARYTSMEMEAIIEKLSSSDGKIYDANMADFRNCYKNEMPYIGLYFKKNTILTNKSVKGEYKSTSYNPYENLTNFCK